jgi:L-amino acid N-acyltransferase YncA
LQLIACTYELHARETLDILNEAIVNSTAIYDYRPRVLASMRAWFQAKEAGGYPVIGAIGEVGQLLGFATYGGFRAWPAYKYSVEHSVYVHREHRGRGIGLALMKRLIDSARSKQYHVLIGGIDLNNRSSIALHEKLGFLHAGTIQHAGFKFGRWLDLAFYELILETPADPVEG